MHFQRWILQLYTCSWWRWFPCLEQNAGFRPDPVLSLFTRFVRRSQNLLDALNRHAKSIKVGGRRKQTRTRTAILSATSAKWQSGPMQSSSSFGEQVFCSSSSFENIPQFGCRLQTPTEGMHLTRARTCSSLFLEVRPQQKKSRPQFPHPPSTSAIMKKLIISVLFF